MCGLRRRDIIPFTITMSEFISIITNNLVLTTLLAYIFGLWATMLVWVWFDVSSRTDNYVFRIGSIILVATGFIFGLAIYLILRPDLTKEEANLKTIEDSVIVSQTASVVCPNCYSAVKENFAFCSNCAFKLQTSCKNCHKKINISWQICPFCGTRSDNMIKTKDLSEIPQVKEAKNTRPKGRPVLVRVVNFLLNPNEKPTARTERTRKTDTAKNSKVKNQVRGKAA